MKILIQNKSEGLWCDALGIAPLENSILCKLTLVDLRTPIGLAPLEIPILALRNLPIYVKDDHN
jgi:hypothetical protein